MKKDQIEEGRISQHSHGLGTITPEMVRARAREIAEINGRARDQVLVSDLDESLRELTGRAEASQNASDRDAEIESAQWDPTPGTPGNRAPTVPAHDEQTDIEKLTEEGVGEAEHDLMVQATEESLQRDEL